MNELQQVLNDIKQDKNTNLLPGNLRDNVTCLGVEGTAEVPEPIYTTTDYRTVNIPSPSSQYTKIFHLYRLDDYLIVSWKSSSYGSNYYLYKKDMSGYTLLGDTNCGTRSSYYGYPVIIGYNDKYVYIVQGQRNSDNCYIYPFNLETNTAESAISEYQSRSIADFVYSQKDGYAISNRTGSGYLFKLNMDETPVTLDRLIQIPSNSYVYNKHQLIFGDSNILTKVNISDSSTVTTNNMSGRRIYGVNYYGTKIFFEDGVYQLSEQLTVSQKLGDFNISTTSTEPIYPFNEKYYVRYNTVQDKATIYEFNEDTNLFTELETVNSGDISGYAQSPDLYYGNYVYDFIQGDTLIGYTVGGNNLYINVDRSITTSSILNGYQAYNAQGSPIVGTMSNNGELNITPTTENQNIPEGYTSGGTVLGDENLKSENIKKNVSIFGVIGSLESSSGQMKLFKTQEEMQADPDAKEGDLAVVYDDSPMKMEAGVYYNGSLTMYFPKVVTLDEAVSSAISNKQWTMLDYNDVGYSLTSSSFKFGTYDYMEDDITGEYATYTSSDGITYTRTTDKDSITFELEYGVVLSTSHSIIGNFLLLENGVFRGLYKYDTKLNELKSKGYINPVVTDEVLSYDKLSSVDINTILPCLKTIYNNDNKSYGRYIVVIKNNGDIFAYDYKDGNSSTDYWTFPGIICDGNKIYISQNYTFSTTHIFRKHKLNTEDGTVESETLSNLSTYQYQTVSDELNKDDIITILTNDGVSSTITVDFFGENSGTDNLNTNRVDLKMAYAEESKYYSAKTQFTIEKPNELLPGLIAYGKSGDVTGDGTIYNNLDCREILKKLYGENNLIYSTDSSKTYACSKDVNNNQIMLSGEVDKLTQFIKLSENIESSTKTAIVRNTSTENYITYDGTCEITINKSSGELLVKNMNTEEEHTHSFVSNPYSVDIRILPNDILLIVQQDNDIPTAIVYKIDLTTQSMTSMTLDCNVSYSSSYKDLEFANVDAINKKLYFISNVQTASTSMKFKFGYINLTNMSAVLLVDKSVTFSSGYPHTQELSTIFTQNGNVVVYMGRYYNSKDYASMTIYSRENDSIVLNVSEKQVNTTGFNNLFKTYCNVVAYDDGTTLYWGSDRLNKSSLEYSFDGTDYTVPYFMDYSGKYAFSYFTGDSIIIFDLEKNTNLSIPFPNVSVAIVDDKYNHSAAGFNCAPIIKDDKLQVLFTGHYFISPIYNVEEASILDYEYMLVCSATSTNAFYPQYSYSKINSGTISSEEYNTALNTAKQIEGSAE